MIPVLSTAESRRLDREAADPVTVLMERAGWAVAGAAIELGAGYGTRVSVLVGPGDNGGDGWVAARRLAGRGCRVTAHQLAEPKTEASGLARAKALEAEVAASTLGRRIAADIVIDALFGSGVRGDLPEQLGSWGDAAAVVAAHVPSGLDPDSGRAVAGTLRASRTVAFHSLSPGHLLGDGPDLCGEVTVADIGLHGGEPVLELVTATDATLPVRKRTAHKWSAGSVLVVGGSPGMIGAAVMAAKSALRFGAGAVGLAVPEAVFDIAALLAPEILSYAQDELPNRYDVIVAGPGMRENPDVVERVIRHDGPIVLDADALTAELPLALGNRSAPTVITPHAGELTRLTGSDAPDWHGAQELAGTTGAVVLLKGNPTVVCHTGPPRLVTSNGPELASIGTGDVLSGMIGALIARGMDPFCAASAAAHWHGVAAADLARARTVTADALVDHVARYGGVTTAGVER